MEYTAHCDSPLGGITLTSDGEALTGLRFDTPEPVGAAPVALHGARPQAVFLRTAEWLTLYFGGRVPDFTPPLRWNTTPFRERVLRILLTIPFGETMTYGEIARLPALRQGTARGSARAVGGAVGANPVLLIVPCHRVVGAGGAPVGYSGGVERKRRLLAFEKTGFLPRNLLDKTVLP